VRTTITLALAAATALSVATPAPAAPARAIAWAPCAEDATVDCGSLVLPIDWADPGTGTYTMALARKKARVRGDRVGTLVFDPGGPGNEGKDWLLHKDFFTSQVHDRFDIVGFDPRGTGESQPITCDPTLVTALPTSDPSTPQGFADAVAYNRKLATDCRQRSGPLFDHIDDLSVARDLEVIRAALGEDKLTYYGVSYGTLIGQQYAELYPNRIRALALDSSMDHSLGVTSFLGTEAQAGEDSFQVFVQWCNRSPVCVLHGQDVNVLFDRLYAKAQAGTLVDSAGAKITPDFLSELPGRPLYAPDWAGIAQQLQAIGAGTFTMPEGGASPYFQFAFCSDWLFDLPTAGSVAYQRKVDNRLAPVTRVSGTGWPAMRNCLGRQHVPNPQQRLDVHGAPAILMVGALHDPATPYGWQTDVAGQLPTATLLTYDGWGHGQYFKSGCVDDAVDDYLISLALPAKGTHCPAVPPAGS
jgi:pimeloyl-ACP methyl ester carboxylesterase